jgi:hypothetical protein
MNALDRTNDAAIGMIELQGLGPPRVEEGLEIRILTESTKIWILGESY